jgi:hypothetical protein
MGHVSGNFLLSPSPARQRGVFPLQKGKYRSQ